MLSTPKRKAIFIILAAVILAAAVFLGWILAGNSTPTEEGTPSYSTEAVDWNEELEGDEPETGYITMPGYDTIPSRQGNTTAEVALANPESNTCYFQFQLIAAGYRGGSLHFRSRGSWKGDPKRRAEPVPLKPEIIL